MVRRRRFCDPVEALGKELQIDGWAFFSSDRIAETFGDASHRIEKLPLYVDAPAVAVGAKTAC
jgi:hypothetical protein